MTGEWIDISIPLRTGMVHWPGDPPVTIERIFDVARGDEATVSAIAMCTHTGTHMDPPLHYFADGRSLDQMPLDVCVGPARVIEIADPSSIEVPELEPYLIQPGERILFKTRSSTRCWATDEFVGDFVSISRAAAEYLAGRGTRLVGIDYLSVGGYDTDGAETHRALLEGGVWILEGLDLSGVEPGPYELICLPLRIANSDGAPARAILRPRR
jgi:arylformamidase